MGLKHLLHVTYHVTPVHVGDAKVLEVFFFHIACATDNDTGNSNTPFLKPTLEVVFPDFTYIRNNW